MSCLEQFLPFALQTCLPTLPAQMSGRVTTPCLASHACHHCHRHAVIATFTGTLLPRHHVHEEKGAAESAHATNIEDAASCHFFTNNAFSINELKFIEIIEA